MHATSRELVITAAQRRQIRNPRSRAITDDSSNLIGTQNFHPFGAGGSLGSGSLQFTGHERDRANLAGGTVNLPDYAHARMLDTDAGRFLTSDPTWESADLAKPQSWNRYSYVMNNPVNMTDPDSKAGQAAVGSLIGAIVGIYSAGVQQTMKALDEPVSFRQSVRAVVAGASGGAVAGAIGSTCPTCLMGGVKELPPRAL